MSSLDILVVDGAGSRIGLSRGQQNALAIYNALTVAGASGTVYLYDGERRVKADTWARVDFPEEVDLLILHNANRADFEDLEVAVGNELYARYTGASSNPPHDASQIWFDRPLTIEHPITDDEAIEIVRWLIRGAPREQDALPVVLGGVTLDELELRLLSALFPYRLLLEKHACEDVVREKLAAVDGTPEGEEELAFEAAVRMRLTGYLPLADKIPWPPERYRQSITTLDQELAACGTDNAVHSRWQECSVAAPPRSVDELLTIFKETEGHKEWDRRLTALRCSLLRE